MMSKESTRGATIGIWHYFTIIETFELLQVHLSEFRLQHSPALFVALIEASFVRRALLQTGTLLPTTVLSLQRHTMMKLSMNDLRNMGAPGAPPLMTFYTLTSLTVINSDY